VSERITHPGTSIDCLFLTKSLSMSVWRSENEELIAAIVEINLKSDCTGVLHHYSCGRPHLNRLIINSCEVRDFSRIPLVRLNWISIVKTFPPRSFEIPAPWWCLIIGRRQPKSVYKLGSTRRQARNILFFAWSEKEFRMWLFVWRNVP
jgi:hypothetical protein